MLGDSDYMTNMTAYSLPFRPAARLSSGLRLTGAPLTVLGAAVAATLLLSGCQAKPAPEEAPTVTVQVAGAAKQPIQLKVNADAVVYPFDQASIVPKIAAPVKKFYVEKGAHVRSGQLLVELENR